jgi:hypothetical protein
MQEGKKYEPSPRKYNNFFPFQPLSFQGGGKNMGREGRRALKGLLAFPFF